MGLVDAVKSGISNYANFSGRASRSEYWFWVLGVLIGYIVFGALMMVSEKLGLLLVVFYLGIIIPSLSVAVRRLHDTDKSGWMILISLIPLIGLIVLYWYCVRGTDGPNQYGDDPFGRVSDTFS